MTFKSMRVAAFAAAAVLAACQHQAPVQMPVLPDNIQTGDTLVLAAPLSWSGGGDIIFQNERPVAAAAVMPDVPYCAVRPVANAPRALAAGPLTVRNVFYDERGSGGPGGTNSVTRVIMVPGDGKGTYAMTCGWPQGSRAGGFVSVPQIFNAVGGQFSLGVPK
jgi:hypothetical protein